MLQTRATAATAAAGSRCQDNAKAAEGLEGGGGARPSAVECFRGGAKDAKRGLSGLKNSTDNRKAAGSKRCAYTPALVAAAGQQSESLLPRRTERQLRT